MDWASTARSFSRDHIWDPAQLVVMGVALGIGLACVSIRAQRSRGVDFAARQGAAEGPQQHLVARSASDKECEPGDEEYCYDAYDAWLRAGVFVSACFVLSWGSGVLDATFFHLTSPLLEESPYFITFTASSFATVLIGYWIIWPLGTVSYGRDWGWHCVLFGVVDGLAESQLFLCIWSVVELIGMPRYGTGLLTFVVQGGFKANWDQKFWNVYVAPAHNIEEWNKWKVLLVHVPNVLVTFSYFITYGNATLYCATQTLALVGSTSFMRFPSPFSKYTNPPLRTQVACRSNKAKALLWHCDHWDEASETHCLSDDGRNTKA